MTYSQQIKRNFKISILLLVLLTVVIIVLIGEYKKTQLINFAEENSISLSDYVSRFVQIDDEFSTEEIDFLDTHFHSMLVAFNAYRVKIWSPEGKVLYSDEKKLIGFSFIKGKDFQSALNGETIAEYSHLVKEENLFERGKRQILLEVYTPLYNEQGRVVGILELYYDVSLAEQILAKHEHGLKFIVLLLAGLVACFIIYLNKSTFKVVSASEKEKKEAKEKADLLLNTTLQITSTLNIDEILKKISQSVIKHTNIRSVSTFFQEGKSYYLKTHSNYTDEGLTKLNKQVLLRLEEQDVIEGFYIENLSNAPQMSYNAQNIYTRASGYIYPIKWDEEHYGIILFEAKDCREFSDEEVTIFKGIANQIGVAFRNAQLYSQVKQEAHADGLTQLYNYRYFQKEMDRIIQKNSISKTHFSLLIIDIDYFKKINDTYGHQVGDKILQKLALIIKDNVRQKDIVSRYGGEEFVVILESCKLEAGIEIAERIRKSVEMMKFIIDDKTVLEGITISIGISSYPDQGSTKDQVIKNSDIALYNAKRLGRNQVCNFKEE